MKSSLLKLLVVAAILAVSAAVRADVIWDTSPGTAAPPGTLGGYSMTAFPPDPRWDEEVASVPSPLGGSVDFDIPLFHTTHWPLSHGYTGDVYVMLWGPSVTMTLPADTQAFYFYAEPLYGEHTIISATATDGSVFSMVAQDVLRPAGAKYFGAYSLSGPALASITVTGGVEAVIGEFGIFQGPPSGAAPEPSSMLLLGLGALTLAVWRRRV